MRHNRNPLSRLREEALTDNKPYATPPRKRDIKECPTCGRDMFLRLNKRDNTSFWGCSGYPSDCRQTLPR